MDNTLSKVGTTSSDRGFFWFAPDLRITLPQVPEPEGVSDQLAGLAAAVVVDSLSLLLPRIRADMILFCFMAADPSWTFTLLFVDLLLARERSSLFKISHRNDSSVAPNSSTPNFDALLVPT